MIQRIQTVYFIIVIIICTLMFFLPVFSGSGTGAGGDNVTREINFKQSTVSFNPELKKDFYDNVKLFNIVLNALNILILAQVMVAIILYTNRKLQLKFTWYCLILTLFYIALLFAATSSAKDLVKAAQGSYGVGFWLPVLSPILLFMASRGIAKDMKIVRSADRLR